MTESPVHVVRDVLAWAPSVDVVAIEEKWIPGATAEERTHLAAFGPVVRHFIPEDRTALLPHGITTWFDAGPRPPRALTAAFGQALERDPAGLLATVYEHVVAPGHRRALGTFFTPRSLVNEMIECWSATQPAPTSVADVGAGVGVFTVAAAERWPRATIHAVDVNPVTLGLLAAFVSQSRLSFATSREEPGVHLVLDDFIAWLRPSTAESPGSRLILGNPPYTRLQLLTREDRARLREAVPDLCGSRSSLAAWMLGASLNAIGPADGLCLVLPAHWLEADYARRLRERLWAYRNRRVEIALVGSSLFPDARVDSVTLLVGTERREAQPLVVRSDGAEREIEREGESPATFRGLLEADLGANPRPTGRRSSGATRPDENRNGRDLSSLATVRRGVATGCNDFFLVSDTVACEWRLPDRVLVPVIRRLRQVGDLVDSDYFDRDDDRERRWLLWLEERDARLVSIGAYIQHGKEARVHERELCRRREVWYDLRGDAPTPDVVIGPMTRDGFRIVDNRAGATITNNLYGLSWAEKVDSPTRARVVQWLREETGQAALRNIARRQAHGLLKLEPGALRRLAIPRDLLA